MSGYIEWLWPFHYTGYLPVGFFLFCSGYGLVISLRDKDRYLRSLLLLRIPAVIIAYLVANLIYLCARLATGTMNRGSLFDFLFGGGALVTYSWYIVCIVYLYIAFGFIHSFWGKYAGVTCAAMVLAVILWTEAMIFSGGGPHRYNAVICFLGGYFAGGNDNLKRALVGRRASLTEAGIFLISCPAAAYSSINGSPLYIRLIFMELSVCAFVGLALNIGVVFDGMEKSWVDRLGKMSLEFYMYQGLVMLLLRNQAINITCDLWFGILTIAGSVLAALLMNRIDGKLKEYLRKAIKI